MRSRLCRRPGRFPADEDRFSNDDLPVADAFGHKQVADLYGHARTVTSFGIGGRPAFAMPIVDDPTPEGPWGSPPPEASVEELQLVLETLDRFERQGLTAAQLRTVRALWLERISLREHAKREGVAPAAIHARIFGTKGHGGLVKVATEFVSFWRTRQERSRKREPCGAGR